MGSITLSEGHYKWIRETTISMDIPAVVCTAEEAVVGGAAGSKLGNIIVVYATDIILL